LDRTITISDKLNKKTRIEPSYYVDHSAALNPPDEHWDKIIQENIKKFGNEHTKKTDERIAKAKLI